MEVLHNRRYPSLQAARKEIDDLALRLGYSFVVHRSNPNSKNPNSIILRCSRGRSASAHPYRNTATPPEKRRKGVSKMTNCPARIAVRVNKPLGNIPQPRFWYIEVTTAPDGGSGGEPGQVHNHEPAKGPGEFSRLRREAAETRKCYVMALAAAGVSPTGIVAVMRQDVDEVVRTVTTHDVSNLVKRVKMEEEQKKEMEARGLNPDGTPLVREQVQPLRQPDEQGDERGEQQSGRGAIDGRGAGGTDSHRQGDKEVDRDHGSAEEEHDETREAEAQAEMSIAEQLSAA